MGMTFSNPRNGVAQGQRTKESQHTTLEKYKKVKEKRYTATYLGDGILEGKTASSLIEIMVLGDRL